ncbi:MAG: CUB domain-containing protein [Flavobacterium haoranii]
MKTNTYFFKNFLVFLFFIFTSITFGQSNNCAATPTLTIGTICTTTNYNVANTFTDSGVAESCTGTSHRDGWYTFTTGASTTLITINGTSDKRLGLALYTGACGSLSEVICTTPGTANANISNQIVLPNTTYRLRLMRTNNDNNNDMTGTICVIDTTPAACTGTPTAGTTTVSPTSGAAGSTYTVSNTGHTTGSGITYQWQSNTNSAGWVNVGAATATYANYNATAPGTIGTTIAWRLVVTCTASSQSSNSSTSTFTVVSTLNVPTTGSNTVTCGTNITLYDNGGPSSNYANSSSGYTVLQAGAAGIINISGSYVTESGYDYVRIYDGTGTGGTLLASYSGSGTINYTGTAGQTLTVQFYSDSGTNYSGFTLSITYTGACTLSPCTGTPNGGTVTTNPNTGWPGSSYTVSATGYEIALNLTYQWQYSLDGGATWVNAGAATGTYANYTATAPASGNVLWHLLVTCTNSGQTGTSSNGTFVTMAVSAVETGCPNVVSGGLGLSGADPVPFNCTDTSTCVDLEAIYLDLGDTTSYIVEPILYNPPFAFNGLANPISVNTDDVWSPIITLPFDFCFYGNTFTECLVGSNGVLTFDTTNNTAGGTCGWSMYGSGTGANLPVSGHGALIENSIFGVFHDMHPTNSGNVGWELITLPSGCRALVVSWYNVPMYSNDNANDYTGMMVLYENTNIIEVYVQKKRITSYQGFAYEDDIMFNDGNAVIGIQNADGTIASVPPGRNVLDPNWTATNEAWRFVPNGTSIASLTWYEGSGTSGPVLGTTDVINVCPTATTTYTAEITYTLCDGRTITELDETTVTVNGAKVWNGSVDTDWDKANNWTPVGIPTAMDCVVIPDTANDPIISGTGYNGLGLNMSIQNDAMLTVNSDNAVSITDWVNISTTGELVLDNAASLIQTNNIANTGTGNMLMDRDVNIRRLDYVYWSSPVTSFLSSAISPGSPTNLIWKWIPTVTGNGIGNGGDWVNGNETMTLGKGYIVRGPSSYTSTLQNFTATFVGTPNNGDISIPISRGNYTSATTYQICATCTPATNLDDNWNLVGNPYPSAIDANDFMTLNTNIDGYIKLWTHGTLPDSATADPFYEGFVYNYTIADYITYNHLGTLPSPDGFDGYIAAGQGFFVSMLDGGPATQNLNFTNALRSNTYDNGQFYRNTNNSVAPNEKHRIWLDIINTTNNSSMTALIGYADGASNSRDRLYDAETDNKVTLNLFSLIDDVKFAIQGRQTPFDDNDVVPLGFRAPSNGIYSIGIKSIDGLFETTAQAIFLHDLELNIIHDLRSMPYSFQANEGTNNNRFNLIFKNTLSENTTELNDNSVWISSSTGLTVHSSIENITSIKVFDILGRVLSNKENAISKTIVLDQILKTNSGLILEITLENGKTIYKKTVY